MSHTTLSDLLCALAGGWESRQAVLKAVICTEGFAELVRCLKHFSAGGCAANQAGYRALSKMALCPADFLLLVCGCDVLDIRSSVCRFVRVDHEPCGLAVALSATCHTLRNAFAFLRRACQSWRELSSPLGKILTHHLTWRVVLFGPVCPGGYLVPDTRILACKHYASLLKEHREPHLEGDMSRLDRVNGFNSFAEKRVYATRFRALDGTVMGASLAQDGTMGTEEELLSFGQWREVCSEAGSAAVAEAMSKIFTDVLAPPGSADEAYLNILIEGRHEGRPRVIMFAPGSANERERAGYGGAHHRLVEHLVTSAHDWPTALIAASDLEDKLQAASILDPQSPEGLTEACDAISALKQRMKRQYPQYVDSTYREELANNPRAEMFCFAVDASHIANGSLNTEFVLAMLSRMLSRLPGTEAKLEGKPLAILLSGATAANIRAQLAVARFPTCQCLDSATKVLQQCVARDGLNEVNAAVAARMGVERDCALEAMLRDQLRCIFPPSYPSTRSRGIMRQASFFSQHSRGSLEPIVRGDHSLCAALFLMLIDRGHSAADLSDTPAELKLLGSDKLTDWLKLGSEAGASVLRGHFGTRVSNSRFVATEKEPAEPELQTEREAEAEPLSFPQTPSPRVIEQPAAGAAQTPTAAGPTGAGRRQSSRHASQQEVAARSLSRSEVAETMRREAVGDQRTRDLVYARLSNSRLNGLSEAAAWSKETERQEGIKRGPRGEEPPEAQASAYAEDTKKRGADGTSLWEVLIQRNRSTGWLQSSWVLAPPKLGRRR